MVQFHELYSLRAPSDGLSTHGIGRAPEMARTMEKIADEKTRDVRFRQIGVYVRAWDESRKSQEADELVWDMSMRRPASRAIYGGFQEQEKKD